MENEEKQVKLGPTRFSGKINNYAVNLFNIVLLIYS